MKNTPFSMGLLLALSLSTPLLGQDVLEVTRAYREKNGGQILQDFKTLLSIPNDAHEIRSMWRNAMHLAMEFEMLDVDMDMKSISGKDHVPPLLYGKIDVPGATRTIGIYVHYDGQPVDPEKWTHAPYEPALYSQAMENGGEEIEFPDPDGVAVIDPEWRLYARSSGDDKAPLMALMAAFDALRQADIPITSNIRFMFEGQEEIGSLHLREYLAHYNDLFREPDVWLICDGPVHQTRAPQLVFGVRGVTSMEITVYGANRTLHSGHYGNFSPNPGMMLAQLLGSMKDGQGNVLVEGYYDSVEPLSQREREALAKVPDISDQLRREFGLGASELDNAPYAQRLLLPSLNIKGITCAAVGRKARNIIPSEATVAMDLRLVKGNDPRAMQDLVEAHIRKQGYHIVREDPDQETRMAHAKIAKVTRGSGYRAARSSMDQPIVDQLVKAARRASGEEVILMPSLGGSLPLYLFNEMLDTPVIIVPIANHDDNQHAPDENIRLANLWYGIDLMGQILTMEP